MTAMTWVIFGVGYGIIVSNFVYKVREMSKREIDNIEDKILGIKEQVEAPRTALEAKSLDQAITQMRKMERQKDQTISKIYELMLIQHSKIRILFRQKSHLITELDKVTASCQQLKEKHKGATSAESSIHTPQKPQHIQMTNGVYIILHFKDERLFEESIPFLETKAKFLSMEEFRSMQDNMEPTSRGSSRMELETSYAMLQLNQKIDAQAQHIEQLNRDLKSLNIQNEKLRKGGGGGTQALMREIEGLRVNQKSLQGQLLNESQCKTKLESQLSSMKERERSCSKHQTIMIRR